MLVLTSSRPEVPRPPPEKYKFGSGGGVGQGKGSNVLYAYCVPDMTLLFYPQFSSKPFDNPFYDEVTEIQKREGPCPGPESEQPVWAPEVSSGGLLRAALRPLVVTPPAHLPLGLGPDVGPWAGRSYHSPGPQVLPTSGPLAGQAISLSPGLCLYQEIGTGERGVSHTRVAPCPWRC